MRNLLIILISIFTLTSCATIVNDPNVPVALSFSDGSDGECRLSNKRGAWSGKIPQTFMIRRVGRGVLLPGAQIFFLPTTNTKAMIIG